MAGRGFCVKVQLDLHAITCPGVWLCPNGNVALRITSLGSTLQSHRVSPIFPLLFHNEFNFKKTFTRLAALTELQRNLEKESLYAELIQWLSPCNQVIVLATFETNLSDVLYPVSHYKGLMPGVDVDLLMDPTKYFPTLNVVGGIVAIDSYRLNNKNKHRSLSPKQSKDAYEEVTGIIAPKIEISTKTVIEEVSDACDVNIDRAYVINPKTINSKRTSCVHRKRPVKGIIRQRRVCHSRAKPRVQMCRAEKYRGESSNVEFSCPNQQSRINECYHPMSKIHRGDTTICGEAHMFDSCPVCMKYKCYFSCECNDERKQISDPIESLKSSNVENFYSTCRCCGCGVLDDSLVSREAISTTQPKSIQYLRKNEKSNYPGKDYRENISECDVYTQDQIEASQGFYKNLERFYKRMYKQAKLRAQEAEERT